MFIEHFKGTIVCEASNRHINSWSGHPCLRGRDATHPAGQFPLDDAHRAANRQPVQVRRDWVIYINYGVISRNRSSPAQQVGVHRDGTRGDRASQLIARNELSVVWVSVPSRPYRERSPSNGISLARTVKHNVSSYSNRTLNISNNN
jgi:hypothetical protein